MRCAAFVLAGILLAGNTMAGDWTKELVERKVHGYYEIETDVADPENRHFWYTSPPNLSYQRLDSAPRFSRAPSRTFADSSFGNQVLYWDHGHKKNFSLKMDWQLTVRNVLTVLDPARVGAYDPLDKEYILYTRSERLTHINGAVLAIKAEIERKLGGEKNPVSVAKATYRWVLDHMAYALLDDLNRDRGTDELLEHAFSHRDLTYYKGDCGEYTLLYNAILRAFGIPARTITGGWSMSHDQWHVWSEVYFPGYGWVPVDTSAADVFVYDEGEELNALGDKRIGFFPQVKDPDFYFGGLDPFRFVMSVGNDIPLEPVLHWDFSADKLGWYYRRGSAGYIQVGIFHIPSLRSLKIHFEEVP